MEVGRSEKDFIEAVAVGGLLGGVLLPISSSPQSQTVERAPLTPFKSEGRQAS